MAEEGKGQTGFDGANGQQFFRSLYLHMGEAAALHELVLDEAGVAKNYRILDVNPQFRRYVGIEPDQVVGKLATEVYGTAEPPYLKQFSAVAMGGEALRFESYFAPLDRYYEISVAPFGTRLFATIFLDITERKRQEKALRESEWFLQKSQRVAHIGSYRFNAATGTWTSSEALNEVFGIDGEFKRDIAGWLGLVHPDEREALNHHLTEEVLGSRGTFDRRYRIIRANDGAVRWVHGLGELEIGSDGRPISMIGTIQDVTDGMAKEQALRASEERFRRIFDVIPNALTLAELDGTLVACNEAFGSSSGYGQDLIGKSPADSCIWVDPSQREALFARMRQGEAVDGVEFEMRRRDGKIRTIQISSRILEVDGKTLVLSAGRDITEHRNLEQQMLHSQKLESLGVLAGGIAHDFNNLLTGILGNADLAKTEMSPLAPSRASLEGIEVAARRAADLCRQLLAYSGRGRFTIQTIDLEELVSEMGHLLSVSISKKVALEYRFAADLPAIEADATQIRQVIMNLIVNASEAIADSSGTISVTTGLARCDANFLKGCFGADGIEPGDFVYLEVADSGHGMDRETLDRIFDPFFSTKFTGRGLGLAAVLGIVRGHRGAIRVYSEVGRGTTFKLLFPASDYSAHKLEPKLQVVSGYHGAGKILLADDEDTIRNLCRRMLQRVGFEVIVAADGREAVDLFAKDKDSIQLVILDLTMPHLDGEACYRELRQLKPGVKVILSSGYNEQDIVTRFTGKGLAGFVQKPYTSEELLAKIRLALGN